MKWATALLLFALAGAEVPDQYNGLSFGSPDSALRAQYPDSERHRFVLSRLDGVFPPGVTAHRLVHKKGPVDSVRFYFVDGRFAMAVEYHFPGREFRDKAYQSATARFGQFVGTPDNAWRRRGKYLVILACQRPALITTLSFLTSDLSGRLKPPSDAEAIDAELRVLQTRLDSLSQAP